MTSRSHETFHRLPKNIYRDLSELCLDFHTSHSNNLANLSRVGRLDPWCEESNYDPIAYDMNDVIKHLRGACGVVDSTNSAATETNRVSRREDV